MEKTSIFFLLFMCYLLLTTYFYYCLNCMLIITSCYGIIIVTCICVTCNNHERNIDLEHLFIVESPIVENIQYFELENIENNPNLSNYECCICLDNNKKDLIILKCNHIYHKDCIDKWFDKENSCPLCRKMFTV